MKYIITVIIVSALGIFIINIKGMKEKTFKDEWHLIFLSQQNQDKGVGPVKDLKLRPVDKKLASAGQQLFSAKCVACHSLDQQIVGPPLRNVTKRRTPEYVMNMILNPTNMEKEDAVARDLHKKYIATPMTDQGFTQDQARSLLEYLRSTEK